MGRYFHDIIIAIESIMANQLRSILTALGIIFGVAAVITMLAIGKGAQKEILDQIKMVGVNNIIVTPIIAASTGEDEESAGTESQKKKFSPGLTLNDVEAIREVIPTVHTVSAEIAVSSTVVKEGKSASAKLLGVSNNYFDIFNLPLAQGVFFNEYQEEFGITVCVIGDNIRNKFFAREDPIGKYIKFDNVWLKVIGVLQKTEVTLTRFENIGVNVMNDNIYIPVQTMLLRYQNRALVGSRIKASESAVMRRGPMRASFTTATASAESGNYNQLDRIIVQVNESNELAPSTDLLARLLLRRHEDVKDFEVTVPELLLKQEQRTKDIFNIVLGAIASISLLVGGIGIMNIMFASVMERIKEIGTRLAIGAQKRDIVVQFLAEAVLISVSGGLLGVIIGILASWMITNFADIATIVTPVSVIISFAVSATVGVVFGYSPAKRASERDPIESLRYE
jgi:putative ABC transport system permease protein